MTSRRWLSSLLALSVLVAAPDVSASQHFPTVIKTELGLRTAPECTLCHMDNKGGADTAKQPFALAMQRLGVVKKNDGSLIAALQEADARGTDSDGDCVADIDELRAGTNPNVFDKPDGGSGPDAGHTSCAPPPPLPPLLETGCSTSLREAAPTYALAVAVCVLLGVRTRRKKEPGRAVRCGGQREWRLIARRPNRKENTP